MKLSNRERQVYDILAEKGPLTPRQISIEMYGDENSVPGVRVWLYRLRQRGVEMTYKSGHVMLGPCLHLAGSVCPMCNEPLETLESLGDAYHRFAVAKGWWNYPEEQRVERLLDWIIEEVEEAREAYRTHGKEIYASVDEQGNAKPEGFGTELSDALGIILDLAVGTDQHLLSLFKNKLEYDYIRKYRRDAEGSKIAD